MDHGKTLILLLVRSCAFITLGNQRCPAHFWAGISEVLLTTKARIARSNSQGHRHGFHRLHSLNHCYPVILSRNLAAKRRKRHKMIATADERGFVGWWLAPPPSVIASKARQSGEAVPSKVEGSQMTSATKRHKLAQRNGNHE